MHLGIFAKTFARPKLEQTLDAVVAHGLTHIQFNMSCMGLPTLPDKIDEGSCVWIAQSLAERGLSMAAISGTFNMVDPDDGRLAHNLRRLDALAAACRWLDTRIITLCTGSLDPRDMWKAHPDNTRKTTWERLLETMRQAVKIADRHEVTLAFEPEINNVVSSVMRARRLLDEVQSPWLKVVIDPANLLDEGDLARLGEILAEASFFIPGMTRGMKSATKGRWVSILEEALDWLGPEIVLAHAKNPANMEELFRAIDLKTIFLRTHGVTGRTLEKIRSEFEQKPGERVFRNEDAWEPFYRHYLTALQDSGFEGALIIHGLNEDDVGPRVAFLREMLTWVSARD